MVASEEQNRTPPQIIDLYSGKVISNLQEPDPDVIYFTSSWSNHGTMIASGTYPGFYTVIWDPETGEELTRSETVEGFMMRAQFSPDDRILAAPTVFPEGNSFVYLIDTQTGETVGKLPSEDGWSIVAMWAPDGKTLAVGYQTGTIKLWDTQTWTVKKVFSAHQGRIWDLNWSPNGQRIISGDTDNGIVHIWEIESGNIVMTLDKTNIGPDINDLDWSPDGQFVVIHGIDSNSIPVIRRAWQSTEELIEYAYECCVWRELTAGERAQFGLGEGD
jgi:WD40 repeat protein